ncbi:hypothetical protein ACI65C_005345 [Semiaphis heraclei]
MSLRHFRRQINKEVIKELNPIKEVSLPEISILSPPNIEEHNIVIPVGLSFKNMMHLNYTSQLEFPPVISNSVGIEGNKNIKNDNISKLENKIQKWVLQYNVSRNCVNDLLGILRSEGLELPKDVRTLMKTPKKHNVVDLNPGNSDILGSVKIDLSSQSSPIEISLDEIKYKCFCVEMSDNAIVFTLSHNITF